MKLNNELSNEIKYSKAVILLLLLFVFPCSLFVDSKQKQG